MVAMFVVRSGQNEHKLHKGPPIDASCQVWFHLAKWFQRRRFLKTRPIRIKNCSWQPCLSSDRDEMNKFHKGPPKDASCQVWFHLAKRFHRRRFLKARPIRIKNCAMAAMFVVRSGQNQQNLYRTSHRCFLSSLVPFGQAVSDEKIFENSANQN